MNTTLPKTHVTLMEAIHNNDLTDKQRRVLAPMVDAICDETSRRRRILDLIQEALSQLRMDMKYLMFDNSALKRERDEARRRSL